MKKVGEINDLEPFLKSKLQTVHEFELAVKNELDLFKRIYADDSLFFMRWHEKNGGSFDVNISNWDTSNLKDLRRTQKFNIRVLLRKNECIEQQRWYQLSDKQFSFEASNRIIGNSFSDFFSVEFRVSFLFHQGGCKVVCSAGVHFTSEIPLSGKISTAVLSQFNQSFPNMASLMTEFLLVAQIVTKGLERVDESEPAVVVFESLSGEYLGVKNNRVFFSTTVTRWVINRNSPTSFSIKHEPSGRYLGHNFFGFLVADAKRVWPWEDFQIDAIKGTGRIILISTNWNFKRGANIVQHKRTGELMCSNDRVSQEGVQLLIRSTQMVPASVVEHPPPDTQQLVVVQYVKTTEGTMFRLAVTASISIAITLVVYVMWNMRRWATISADMHGHVDL